jgi:predicted ATPase
MINDIHIKNYKSIEEFEISLGRVNVFIGENGCGKTNILEALVMAAASSQNKLDNEFLSSRGVRVTEPIFMRSGFTQNKNAEDIEVSIKLDDTKYVYSLKNDNTPFSKWQIAYSFFDNLNVPAKEDEERPLTIDYSAPFQKKITEIIKNQLLKWLIGITPDKKKDIANNTNDDIELFQNELTDLIQKNLNLWIPNAESEEEKENLTKQENNFRLYLQRVYERHQENETQVKRLSDFLIFCPENYFLRNFQEESQIQPLGVRGDGLFNLLTVLNKENPKHFNEIKEHLSLINWYSDLKMSEDSELNRKEINIRDKFLVDGLNFIDQRSSNEGFLYLLFYFTLFISDYTPRFFAVDNIDSSLNPKLCTRLVEELTCLANKHDKQVILTTHNPAILDGLDLADDEQRLFVIYRNAEGRTKAERVKPAKKIKGVEPIRNSEAFIRGYLGGLPKNF